MCTKKAPFNTFLEPVKGSYRERMRHAGTLVGFVNLGDVNNHLLQFEESLDEESQPVFE